MEALKKGMGESSRTLNPDEESHEVVRQEGGAEQVRSGCGIDLLLCFGVLHQRHHVGAHSEGLLPEPFLPGRLCEPRLAKQDLGEPRAACVVVEERLHDPQTRFKRVPRLDFRRAWSMTISRSS